MQNALGLAAAAGLQPTAWGTTTTPEGSHRTLALALAGYKYPRIEALASGRVGITG